jgi:ribosomal protein L37AE/L43A
VSIHHPESEIGVITFTAADESCPGCGQIEGVEQTTATNRVAAWKCTHCGMCWAISVVRPDSRAAVLLTDLGTAAAEIGRLHRVLREVITLADDAPHLADVELRDRLLTLASAGPVTRDG